MTYRGALHLFRVQYWTRLHAQCGSVVEMAERSGTTKRNVYNQLEALGLEPPKGPKAVSMAWVN
jgi:hypothetical protein